jgi:hypothetical protein
LARGCPLRNPYALNAARIVSSCPVAGPRSARHSGNPSACRTGQVRSRRVSGMPSWATSRCRTQAGAGEESKLAPGLSGDAGALVRSVCCRSSSYRCSSASPQPCPPWWDSRYPGVHAVRSHRSVVPPMPAITPAAPISARLAGPRCCAGFTCRAMRP